MADLELNGPLDLMGTLDLAGQGGKVKVNGVEALVEQVSTDTGIPVLLPSPSAPADNGTKVVCVHSLGSGTVKTAGTVLVTLGLVLQGNSKTWPGMITPSTNNTGPSQVTAGGLAINVVGDSATVFPNGSSATFSAESGQ